MTVPEIRADGETKKMKGCNKRRPNCSTAQEDPGINGCQHNGTGVGGELSCGMDGVGGGGPLGGSRHFTVFLHNRMEDNTVRVL